MTNEISQTAVPGIVHQQHGRFLAVSSQKFSRESAFDPLARIAPVVGILENGFDVVVARKDESLKFGVMMDRIALAQLGEDGVGVLTKKRVQRHELDSGREGRGFGGCGHGVDSGAIGRRSIWTLTQWEWASPVFVANNIPRYSVGVKAHPVPEPAFVSTLAAGLMMLAFCGRLRAKSTRHV